MSRTIKVKNNLTDSSEKTYFTTDTSSGGTVLPVQNTNAFYANWGIQVGETGDERSEIKVLAGSIPSGTSLFTTAALSYDHPADTPVYAIKYDQIIFKKSTTGTAGTASIITDGTVTVTPDSDVTQYDDTAGNDSDAYRVVRWSSGLAVSTDNSDWLTSSGYSFYSLAKLRERAKRKIFNPEFIQNDSYIDDWFNEWLEMMTNTAVKVNRDYLIGSVDVSIGTSGLGTITSDDFKEVRRVWFTTNGSDYYTASKLEVIDFFPDETFDETQPYFYMQGDTVIGKKPEGTAGTASILYYKRPTVLKDETDELPPVMRSYTKSFVDYARSQAAYLDGKIEMGDRYFAYAQSAQESFEKEITPRHKTGIQYITLESPIDGGDEMDYLFSGGL